jgi:hypothetical protein
MMASVSDSIRALTGVFTTLLQIMSDEPASSSWLPDADALDRPCRILFAIAVISDNLHATAEPFPSRLGLLLFSRWRYLMRRSAHAGRTGQDESGQDRATRVNPAKAFCFGTR